jgi:hypothetical protein
VAETLDTKYHLEPATCYNLDIDSDRTKDSGARLTYELRNYVTTLQKSPSVRAAGQRMLSTLSV